MLVTVLQLGLKAVMTRQHTFLLKCVKFYNSFASKVMTRQHKLAQKLGEVQYKKKHLSYSVCMCNVILLVNDQD